MAYGLKKGIILVLLIAVQVKSNLSESDLESSETWIENTVPDLRYPKLLKPAYIYDPKGDAYFYLCVRGFAFEFKCPEDKVFDFQINKCKTRDLDDWQSAEDASGDDDAEDDSNEQPMAQDDWPNKDLNNGKTTIKHDSWNEYSNNDKSTIEFDSLDDDTKNVEPTVQDDSLDKDFNILLNLLEERKSNRQVVVNVIEVQTIIEVNSNDQQNQSKFSKFWKDTTSVVLQYTATLANSFCKLIGC